MVDLNIKQTQELIKEYIENIDKSKSSSNNNFMDKMMQLQMMKMMSSGQNSETSALQREIADLKYNIAIQQLINQQQMQQGNPIQPLETQSPFEGVYKSKTGLFKGTTSGQVTLPITNGDVVELLKKITENQEIERKIYERNNPVEGDDPIYDWSEATINPGQAVEFVYIVPEGYVFFFEYLNVVHNIDTTYEIWIDGVYQPTLSYALQDFGDHAQIYKPPKMAYNKVEIHCLNNWIAAQTYATFFRGFNRWYRSINREITYESLEKEKEQET